MIIYPTYNIMKSHPIFGLTNESNVHVIRSCLPQTLPDQNIRITLLPLKEPKFTGTIKEIENWFIEKALQKLEITDVYHEENAGAELPEFTLHKMSNRVAMRSRRGLGNIFVVGRNIISKLPYLIDKEQDTQDASGLVFLGKTPKIKNKQIYTHPNIPEDILLCFYKGENIVYDSIGIIDNVPNADSEHDFYIDETPIENHHNWENWGLMAEIK